MSVVWIWPWALLALVPALIWWWRQRRLAGAPWRLLAIVSVIAAAAGPMVALGLGGSDVVLVLDRSGSMGPESARADELVGLAARQRDSDDRLGIVTVGREAVIAQPPHGELIPPPERLVADPGGSAVVRGIDQALQIIPPHRSGRIVIHSDGHWQLDPVRNRVQRAASRGIRVDVLPALVDDATDAAVVAVEMPGSLRLGAGFVAVARLRGRQAEERDWQVERADGTVIAQGTALLEPGRDTVIRFADRPSSPGVMTYRVILDATADPRPRNNTARAAVRVQGGERLLVVSGSADAQSGGGNIARALRAAGMHVDERAEGPLSLGDLSAYRGVVLDNVPAHALGWQGQRALEEWVRHTGGGLLVGGGRRAFGSGGYHRSPIEKVLPVTCELRDEHRKLSVALVMVADRSGSMGASVPGGRTKMDLANAGMAAAVEMLGPFDDVGVFAVDTAAHEVIGLRRNDQPSATVDRVRRIASTGGGIFIENALVAALDAISTSDRASKHIILFADAADSEQPGDYRNLLSRARAAGITVSVIGLGTEQDPDADLLAEVARLGGGRIQFTTEARELPQLFAQETMLVARTAWVDGPVQPQPQQGLDLWLPGLPSTWPAIPGYNLVYPRPRSEIGAWNRGDPAAPALAAWQIGAGRSVAIPMHLDHPESPDILRWEGYAPLIAGAMRWATGGGATDLAMVSARTIAGQVAITVDADPARRDEWPSADPHLLLLPAGAIHASDTPTRHALQLVDNGRWQAVVPLRSAHPVLPVVRWGNQAMDGPAVSLPYAPELAPLPPDATPARDLAAIARAGGGTVRGDLLGLFDNPASPGTRTNLAPWLAVLGLLSLLMEIWWRRWSIVLWRRRPAEAAMDTTDELATAVNQQQAPSPPPATTQTDDPQSAQPARGLHEALGELRRRRGGS